MTSLSGHFDRWTGRIFLQLGEVFGHLGTVQRLVGALVASAAVDFGDVAQFPFAVRREHLGQGIHVVVVEVARHADAVPSPHPLSRPTLPGLERAGVVAVGAIDPQSGGHVGHQAIGPFGLLDRLPVARGQGGGAPDPNVF